MLGKRPVLSMLAEVNTASERSRNLILIGFMGTGKTTVGKRVARSLGFRFVDTDALIVKKAGKPIPKIFEEDGETEFRKMETEVLKECAAKSGQVLSTGGGIVTIDENRPLLKEAGYVIWLKAEAEVIYERVRRNRERPLLHTANPEETIRKLLDSRVALYKECADFTIATDNLTMDETCFGVTECARLALEPT